MSVRRPGLAALCVLVSLLIAAPTPAPADPPLPLPRLQLGPDDAWLPPAAGFEGKLAPQGVRPDFDPPCAEEFAAEHYPAADPDPQYDVTHYDIHLELFPAVQEFHGRVRIDLKFLRPLSGPLQLDFCGPPVVAVWNDVTPVTFTRVGDSLLVDLGARPRGDSASVWVEYGGYVSGRSEWRGFYWPAADIPSSPAIFTFSETEWARWWFPGHDVPADKATADLYVTVPSDLTVASNGQLVSDVPLSGGRHEAHWHEALPIATYLLCVHAGPYALIKDERHPAVPVWNYVYPGDSLLALESLGRVPDMIAHFSTLFGPFPFPRYGHAETAFSGGMEHQGMTTLADFVIRNGADSQYIVAHELGHQWWGDSVTLKDWRHLWLNEGFASYTDALWAEHERGAAGLHERMDLFAFLVRTLYDRNIMTTVVDPLATKLFSVDTYDKGAWVLHMLRHIVGDPVFFDILRTYHATYRYGNANTDDFIAVCERVAGRPLRWFFDPWLYGIGLAHYQYDWQNEPLPDGRTLLRVTVVQSQPATWPGAPVFTMPIDFRIRTTREELTRTVTIDHSPQTFALVLDDPAPESDPGAVQLDPDDWILKTVVRTPLAPVEEPAELVRIAPAPPAGPGTISFEITLSGGRVTPARVDIFDVSGRRIARPFNAPLPPGVNRLTWDGLTERGGRAPSGAYFLRVTAAASTRSTRALLLR